MVISFQILIVQFELAVFSRSPLLFLFWNYLTFRSFQN